MQTGKIGAAQTIPISCGPKRFRLALSYRSGSSPVRLSGRLPAETGARARWSAARAAPIFRIMASTAPIGRVVATELKPSTPHQFYFRADPGGGVGIGTLVRV